MKLSIGELKDSNHFLNIIFENITSAIFLIDQSIEVQQFNETFKTLFSKKEDQIIGRSCGNVIGCRYTIEEEKNCGNTSNCNQCIIRKSILKAFKDKTPTFKEIVNRNFYIEGRSIRKFFQFTAKYLSYNHNDMVLVIMDDITEIEKSKLELEKRNKMIERYNHRVHDELILARNVQQNLIPNKLPEIPGVSLSAIYKPLEEVGGDLYDFIKVDEDSVGIFLSDISGHGVPAAMITAMVKAIMETSTHLFHHPAAFISYLNRKLINISENMYLTALYSLYNTKTKKLTYMRCGHPYPILIRNGEYIEIKEGGSTILGMFENINFKSHTLSLQQGDKLIFYTDGLTEAIDHPQTLFKEDLHNIVIKHAHKSIQSLICHVYDDIINFKESKKFEDDVCILGMEIHN
ncbi:PP2C family protein-serine/threonine phosphatase [Marinisporobacter balticus]|uniref:Sigma-B regulation protein RsbU (Phosphoserine phosphatase) n=1 Tax=Marinisporobacter balticus TaxID=2018667 RepID=A0A4R2KA99_9FIRM|nr:PP2C family protein-serine/threonine phosphatase [Marinisporobacter balticus]TCO69694.1 sigma-B regulation protein RsbU (phosphoserine phosphatase) [Marinisporobacter balticus]